ncbi:Phosphoglycerol transferase I [Enterobacter cloacae]|uniref:Phosphoglycerol transferase I n=1 Tax=Enterobacter cloacae TaxID=550 RepID=A0A377M782_ENTCL|nr:Phosphoglycerol transferase I [Enterobacter cloacae]
MVYPPRWWLLGIFIVLNITLYASDYFTGDGINDAVLYTLTNSLTGAGVGKYILPGLGLVLALVTIFGALAWVLRRRRHLPHHHGYSLLALFLALALRGCQPGISSDHRAGEIQSRDGDPDFVAYYKEAIENDSQPEA